MRNMVDHIQKIGETKGNRGWIAEYLRQRDLQITTHHGAIPPDRPEQ